MSLVQFGIMDADWHLRSHSTGVFGGRRIDTAILRLNNRDERTVYFDVTESFGKWGQSVDSQPT